LWVRIPPGTPLITSHLCRFRRYKEKAVCHWLATFKAKASRLFPARQRSPESFDSAWGTSNSRNALAIKKQASYGSSDAHVYKVPPRKDHRGVDLISDVLSFGRLWYGDTNAVANAIGYAQSYSRSHDAVSRVCNDAGNVIETHDTRAISKTVNLFLNLFPIFLEIISDAAGWAGDTTSNA
jgi:hypothetical protein